MQQSLGTNEYGTSQIYFKCLNVIIHCGDFHFMKENFAVIGKIKGNTRFEDTIFQVGVRSIGSLNGILPGSHYNRAWTVNAVFAALEWVMLERFLSDFEGNVTLPAVCFEAAQDHEYFTRDASQEDPSFFISINHLKMKFTKES